MKLMRSLTVLFFGLALLSFAGHGEVISPADFKAKIDQATNPEILDVRTPKEYAEGHVTNAKLMNFYDEDFAAKINALPKDKTYYIYCRSGGRSGKARQMMVQAGFQKVYDMKGGMMAWQKEGLPVQK